MANYIKNKLHRLIIVINIMVLLTITLLFTQAIAPSQMTTWAETSPNYKIKTLPAIVNVGTVSEGVSTAGGRVMWRDSSGQVNLLAAFGDGPWYGHYINMDTGVRKMVQGALKGCAQNYAFNPAYNKLYGATGYAGYNNSFWEFDPATQTVKIIADRNLIGPIGDAVIGGDNRVYLYTQGAKLYSYDPAVGMPGGWKDYGTISLPSLDSGSNYRELAVDKQYIYLGLKRTDGTWTLAITPSGTSNWQEWQFSSAGDQDLAIRQKKTTHEWFVRRRLASGAYKVYWLANGTYSDSGLTSVVDEPDLTTISPFCYSADNEAMYNVYPDNYAWEVDLTELFPIKSIHEYSSIQYRKVGTQTWSGSTVPFTGPWVPKQATCIVPNSDSSILVLSGGYNAAIDLNYKTRTSTYLGVTSLSPYAAIKHASGEIYTGGYPNRILRYDPALPWTLTSANSKPRLPSDRTKPNPYFIMTLGEIFHYRYALDYDDKGVVWIGGNTTRCNPDYGNVMWYNPTNGSTGYMFPGWKAAGTHFSNLCASNNRSRVCVADNKGNIWVINATAKTVDPVPIKPLGTAESSKTYMVEVENDLVLGIVLSDSGNKVIRLKPSTKQILTLQDLGVPGTPFGFADNLYARMNYRLEKGPDGYVWMFVGDSLYRVHPTTGIFAKVLDTKHGQLKFAANNVDLLIYHIKDTTDFKYIPNILERISPR